MSIPNEVLNICQSPDDEVSPDRKTSGVRQRKWISVCHPLSFEDSLQLTRLLQSSLSAYLPASLVVVKNERENVLDCPGQDVCKKENNVLTVSEQELNHCLNLMEQGTLNVRENAEVVFLEVDYLKQNNLNKAMEVLDQLIVVLAPHPTCLTEGYRLIKRLVSHQRFLKVGVVFEGMLEEAQEEFLFEEFSRLVSKHLGVFLSWLGRVRRNPGHAFPAEIDVCLEEVLKIRSIKKSNGPFHVLWESHQSQKAG